MYTTGLREARDAGLVQQAVRAGDAAGLGRLLADTPDLNVSPQDIGKALLIDNDATASSLLLLLFNHHNHPQELANITVDPLMLCDAGDRDQLSKVVQDRLTTFKNIWDEPGQAPYTLPVLHLAACQGHTAACSLLLSSGARLEDRDDVGSTCLTQAASSGNLDTVRVFATAVGGGMWRRHDTTEYTALHEALSRGHEEVVHYIISNHFLRPCDGVNLDASLDLAVKYSAVEKRHRLLSIMAQHCQQDVLKVAWYWAKTNKAEDLRAVLPYCQTLTKGGSSLLHVAGEGCVVRLLLEHSPHLLDSVDSEGFTPLLRAASVGSWDAVKALLAAGADPCHRDQRGRTALHHAAKAPTCRCLSKEGYYPLSGYVSCLTQLRECCYKLGCIRMLAESGAARQGDIVNAIDNHGSTALHCAMKRPRLDSAAFLIHLGALPCPVNTAGKTPLMQVPEDRWLECYLLYAQMRVAKAEMVRDIAHVKKRLVYSCTAESINTLLLLLEVHWVSNTELAELKKQGRDRSSWQHYKKFVSPSCIRLTNFCRSAITLPVCRSLLDKTVLCPVLVTQYVMYADYIQSIREGLFTRRGFLRDKICDQPQVKSVWLPTRVKSCLSSSV